MLLLELSVYLNLLVAIWPGVDSSPNRNEYQGYFLGVELITLPPACPDCPQFWEPQLPGNVGTRPDLYRLLHLQHNLKLIPVVVRSKARVCGRSNAGIVGSNPAEGMDVRLLCMLCVE
jgi:hypothetical protein